MRVLIPAFGLALSALSAQPVFCNEPPRGSGALSDALVGALDAALGASIVGGTYLPQGPNIGGWVDQGPNIGGWVDQGPNMGGWAEQGPNLPPYYGQQGPR